MGVWDTIHSIGDGVKGITPDLSTVKRAGRASYHYASDAVTKVGQVVRVNGIQKLSPRSDNSVVFFQHSRSLHSQEKEKMGVWDTIHSIGDGVKGITPDLSTVKRAGHATYHYASAAVTKVGQVVRVNGIQKLPQYLPDGETRAKIGVFSTTLAKNTAEYAVYEGFKHIPGATVATNLVLKTMDEVKNVNRNDPTIKAVQAKMDGAQGNLRKSTAQPDEVKNLNRNDPTIKAVQAKMDGAQGNLRKSTAQLDNGKLCAQIRSKL